MEEQNLLKRQLEQIDTALVFLLLIILSVLLSYQATHAQRKQLLLAIHGKDAGRCPPVFPIRYAASALIVGALGFFLCLALDTLEQAGQGDDPAALRSARVNAFASVLVLAAALLRLDDLKFTQAGRRRSLPDQEDLPAGA